MSEGFKMEVPKLPGAKIGGVVDSYTKKETDELLSKKANQSDVTELEGKVTDNENNLKLLEGELGLKAAAIDVTGLKGRVADVEEQTGQLFSLTGVKTTKEEANYIVLTDVVPEEGSLDVTLPKQTYFYIYGQNLWDEQWVNEEQSGGIVSKNHIGVQPKVEYCFHCGGTLDNPDYPTIVAINYYGVHLESMGNLTRQIHGNIKFTVPEDCYYIKFKIYGNYGDTYHNDICINISDERINGTYVPYQEGRRYDDVDAVHNVTPYFPVTTIFTFAHVNHNIKCEYKTSSANAVEELEGRVTNVIATKQNELSVEQLANIDAVPNKADKSDVADVEEQTGQLFSLTGVKTTKEEANYIVLTDVVPEEGSLDVTLPKQTYFYIYGQNLWDEQWVNDAQSGDIFSKNHIRVQPKVEYCLHCGGTLDDNPETPTFVAINYYAGDASELIDSSTQQIHGNIKFTVPEDCYYIGFAIYGNYGNTYRNDICINISDERINGTYVPYQERLYCYDMDAIHNVTPYFPVTTIFTYTHSDLSIKCEYKKSSDSVVKELEEKVADIEEQLAKLILKLTS